MTDIDGLALDGLVELRETGPAEVGAGAVVDADLAALAIALSTPESLDPERYQRILGDELRRVRRGQGWTRKDVQPRLPSKPSLQTLATYELGTRQCSVVRFVELCLALEVLPQDVLARTHQRALGDEADPRLRLHLPQLAEIDDPALAPLRHWATAQLTQPGTPPEISLTPDALVRLAELCGLAPADLLGRLRRLHD